MAEQVVDDLHHELEQARQALLAAQSHLASQAQTNATLHCEREVYFPPLHAKVTAAILGIERVHTRSEEDTASDPSPLAPDGDGPWAALTADLDRCEHGRHKGDDCFGCGIRSHGNPHLLPGTVIGYGRYGDPIVMPDRDHKHDLNAWRAASEVSA